MAADGIAVWAFFWTYRQSGVLVVVWIDGRIYWQSSWGLCRSCRRTGRPCWASCLPFRPLTSRHRCDMPVRWPHLSTADCHLVRLSSTTSFGFVCLDRWAFRRRDLVGVFGLVHRRAIWQMPSGLVGSVECGRPEWRGHWLYSLLSWRFIGLFDSSCFARFSQVFVAGFSITCPVHILEVDLCSTRPMNRGQFGVDGDEDGQMIAGQWGRDWPVG